MGKSIIDLSSVTTVGLDLAKHVFQVHGVDALGRVVVAKPIRRNKLLEFFASLPRCLVGLEASGSAHHWARELIKLGHDARVMPPAYVKPYIRRQKNDAADAAAICEAVTRPSMRFVGVRSPANQAALMRHKALLMLVSQRTQLLNGLRGHLTEVGVIAAQGPRDARELAELIEACDETVPFEVCEALAPVGGQGGARILRDLGPQPDGRGKGRRREASSGVVDRRQRPQSRQWLSPRQGGAGGF